MLRHAFEAWGCRRVELKTDALNDRSRGAMEAMGATFEGIHRKHMLVRGGENRDSAWYSISDDEWPAVERGLRGTAAGLASPPRGGMLRRARYPRGTGARDMIESVNVIGARGRVGSAVSARLAERGVELREARGGARPPLRSRPGDRRGRRGESSSARGSRT